MKLSPPPPVWSQQLPPSRAARRPTPATQPPLCCTSAAAATPACCWPHTATCAVCRTPTETRQSRPLLLLLHFQSPRCPSDRNADHTLFSLSPTHTQALTPGHHPPAGGGGAAADPNSDQQPAATPAQHSKPPAAGSHAHTVTTSLPVCPSINKQMF